MDMTLLSDTMVFSIERVFLLFLITHAMSYIVETITLLEFIRPSRHLMCLRLNLAGSANKETSTCYCGYPRDRYLLSLTLLVLQQWPWEN